MYFANARRSSWAGSLVTTTRPLRSTVKRSLIRNTSPSLWLTNSVEMPRDLRSRMIRNRASTSLLVNAVVGSSMMISLASLISAREIATSCLSATERSPTVASRSTRKSIFETASSAIRRKRRQLASRRFAASSVVSARFSITVRFGKMEKSW